MRIQVARLMHHLSTFVQGFNVAIIGSSGSIGKALVESLLPGNAGHIYSFSRNSSTGASQPGKVTHHTIDITDEDSVAKAAESVKHVRFDLIIVATGMLHNENEHIAPEKHMRDISMEQFEYVFAINSFGPALVAKYFIPLLNQSRRNVFAALSARVSSISDNRLGGWYAYRASKAALNMIIKNLSIEVGRRHKESIIIGLHPGTVKSQLSTPFTGNSYQGTVFEPSQAADYLLQVVDQLNTNDSGKLFAWDGKEIIP